MPLQLHFYKQKMTSNSAAKAMIFGMRILTKYTSRMKKTALTFGG
jgi:hypothetical protein